MRDVRDVRDMPARVAQGNEVFLGPTAVDYSMLPAHALVPAGEAKQLRRWAEQDLADFYREQRSNRIDR